MRGPCTLLLVAATAIAGCSGDAMGGGGLPATPGAETSASDAATQEEQGNASDAGALDTGTGDGGSDAAPHLPPSCIAGGSHSGNRWQDLYACYFGPTGIANCALNSSCHVAGSSAATTWTCGSTSDSCYQGMISASLVPDGGATSAMMTLLYGSLRTSDGFGGVMPLDPPDVAFTPDDMMRLATWIQSGAPNN
jgi:hypothetical protein